MSTKMSETSEAKSQHMKVKTEVKTEYMESQNIKLKVQQIEGQTQEIEVKTSKCKYCGKKFAEESVLDEHKLLHKSSDGQQIRCAEDYCGHQFDHKHELKEHLKQFHKNKDKNNMKFSALKAKYELNSNQSTTKRVFDCKECNKQLSSMQSLRAHQKSIHNMVSTFKCKFNGCDQTFEKSSELRVHEEVHRKQKSTIGESID